MQSMTHANILQKSRNFLQELIIQNNEQKSLTSSSNSISLANYFSYVRHMFSKLKDCGAAILEIVQKNTKKFTDKDILLILSSLRFLFERTNYLNTGIISKEFAYQAKTITITRKHWQSEDGAQHKTRKIDDKSVLSVDGLTEEYYHMEEQLKAEYDTVKKKKDPVRIAYCGSASFINEIGNLAREISTIFDYLKKVREELPKKWGSVWNQWTMDRTYTTKPIHMESIDKTLEHFGMKPLEPIVDIVVFLLPTTRQQRKIVIEEEKEDKEENKETTSKDQKKTPVKNARGVATVRQPTRSQLLKEKQEADAAVESVKTYDSFNYLRTPLEPAKTEKFADDVVKLIVTPQEMVIPGDGYCLIRSILLALGRICNDVACRTLLQYLYAFILMNPHAKDSLGALWKVRADIIDISLGMALLHSNLLHTLCRNLSRMT